MNAATESGKVLSGDLGVSLSLAGQTVFAATIPAAVLRAADAEPTDAIAEARELAGELAGDGSGDPIREAREVQAALAAGASKERVASERRCSVDRVVERLALLRLRDELQDLVGRGRLSHKAGLVLSRLPADAQVATAIWAMGGEAGDELADVADGNFLRPLSEIRAAVADRLKVGEAPEPPRLFDASDGTAGASARAPGSEPATGETLAGGGSAGSPAGGEEDPLAGEARQLCAAVVERARTGTAAALASGGEARRLWLARLRRAAAALGIVTPLAETDGR